MDYAIFDDLFIEIMNFLAHTYLSFGIEGLIVGNYLGDFVRNTEVERLPLSVQDGIILHRKIDSFTDQHGIVRVGTKMLHKTMGKYAPVVLDIYFDFLLTKNWSLYSKRTLQETAMMAYDALLRNSAIMNEKIDTRMHRMVADRWLEKYKTYDNLQRIFNFLNRRIKFDIDLQKAPDVLAGMEMELDEVFTTYFPTLITFVQESVLPELPHSKGS